MEITSFHLSETPAIFADFLFNFDKVRKFFPYNFRDDWKTAFENRFAYETPRRAIAETLHRQNQRWEAPAPTFMNIRKLPEANTFAVVTGQQAGILGGPLYTFYKTMTVLKLCERLNRDFPQYHVVPVFWMEVNDSDFQEIASIRYINKENQLKRLEATENQADVQKPINARIIEDQIQQWRQEIADDFFDSEFKEETLNLFIDSYQSGISYADAFARLLLKIFGKYGLIVLNPSEPGICALASPLFEKALKAPADILKVFTERREALEQAGYQAQIYFNPNQTLLFFNDAEMRRVRIDVAETDGFQLKYSEGYRAVDKNFLLKSCVERPEYLSPNVALRPVLQDSLLPTVAYVAGPSETAYFAQVETLYRYFEVPMPVIYPRHRLTIAEGKVEKIIQKFNLDYAELLVKRAGFIEEFIRKKNSRGLFSSIESVEQQIGQALESLRKIIEENDPTLLNTLEKTRQSIEDSFHRLGDKITRSLEEKNETEVRQLERVLQNLLPENNLQEREINFIYFGIKYGMGLIDELYANLPENTDGHLVAKL